MSKQDQALVKVQLEKEAVVRKRVASIKSRLERGLAFVRSLVKSKAEELRIHISSLVEVLFSGVSGFAVSLIGDDAFKTYLVSGQSCCRNDLPIRYNRTSLNAALIVLVSSASGLALQH